MPYQLTQTVTLIFLAAASREDIRSRTIPLALAGIWGVFGAAVTAALLLSGGLSPEAAGFSVLPGIFLLGLALLSEGRIGCGDGLLFVACGLTAGAEAAFFLLCLSTLLAALFGAAGLILGKLKKGARLPFLPFVLAAYLIVLAAGGGKK